MAKCQYHGANRGAIMLVGTRDPAMDNSQRGAAVVTGTLERAPGRRAQQFKAAKAHIEAAKELQSQAPPPNGAHAFRLALRAERRALVQYKRTLRIFTDLVVDGKILEER